MPRVLIITPTYNERENLPELAVGIFAELPEANLLVVDDASPDGTGDVADDMASADPRVHVVHRAGKRGLGTAYLAGFAWAIERGYDYILQMDADLSHDPRHLPDFIRALDEGADLAIGSRNIPGGGVEGWGPLRHFISKGASVYSRKILGLGIHDLTSGYKAFRRTVLQSIDLAAVTSRG